jgi:hypothetical protein
MVNLILIGLIALIGGILLPLMLAKLYNDCRWILLEWPIIVSFMAGIIIWDFQE